MTLDELRQRARAEFLDDVNAGYLWPDAELDGYLNDAVLEAAERAHLIYDSSTAAVCEVALTTAVAGYALHPSIIYLDEIYLDSTGERIFETTTGDLDGTYGRTWRRESGTVANLVRQGQAITVVRTPAVADALRLRVIRRPLDTERLVNPSDVPVIPDQYHFDLLYWLAYRAFSKPDPDGYDEQRAQTNLNLFTARFGPRKSAQFDQIAQQMPRQYVPPPRRFV